MKKSYDPAVFNILLQAIRSDITDDYLSNAEEIIRTNDILWNDLFYSAELNSIIPQLTKLINRVDQSLVPEDFRQKLNLTHQEILCQQMSFASEFIRLRKVLKDAGIIAVPFKGFWIASEFYGNLADRESVDIDLYVHENDLEQIAIIMKGEGYTPQVGFLKYSIKEIKENFHEYNFDRFEGDERLFHVEYHWRISTENYGMDITLCDLSSEIIKGKLQDQEIEVFSPSANFLLAVMHHGGRDLFRELKQVLDFAMIMKREPELDWKMILNDAERFNVRNLVLVAVKLASDLTAVNIPEEISDIAGSEKITRLTENRKKFLIQLSEKRSVLIYGFYRWWFRMRALSSLRIKLKITWLIFVVLFVTYLVPPGLRKYFPYGELAA